MKKFSVATFSCPGNTSCWISSESEAVTGFYTARVVVSPNLDLLGAQYSFELKSTLGAQDPLSVKIYSTRWTPFVLDNLTN